MFTRWGGFVYRRRRWIVLFAVVVAVGLGSMAAGASSHLTTGGWLDPKSESAHLCVARQRIRLFGRPGVVVPGHPRPLTLVEQAPVGPIGGG